MRGNYALGLALGLMLAGAAGAQQPPGQPNPYPPALYRMGDVGKALNLNQEQVNRLNAVTDKLQAQYNAQYGKLNSLNDAERFARTQELNRQYYCDWMK